MKGVDKIYTVSRISLHLLEWNRIVSICISAVFRFYNQNKLNHSDLEANVGS